MTKFAKTKGFTLIELIVAIAIFSIVAVVSVGALVKIVGENRRAQAIQAAVSNIGFTMETISRELRTGSNYHCGTYSEVIGSDISFRSCGSVFGPSLLAFKSSKIIYDSNDASKKCNAIIVYKFVNGNQLQKGEQSYCNDGVSAFYPIISSPNINLQGFDLNVGQTGNTAVRMYDWAYIHLKGVAGSRLKDQSAFDVQTYITQRIDD